MGRSLRLLLLPLLLTALLSGCESAQDQGPEDASPFVFRRLDLNQRRDDGSRDWDLTSPEARYNLETRTVQAQRPTGLLYRLDEPYLRISAEKATIINDGERIVLEGNVQLQQLTDQGLLLRGERLVWTPEESRIAIDRLPRALDADAQLSAERFVLLQDRNQLLLNGPTRLQHWSGNRSNREPADRDIRGGSGSWNLQTGELNLAGPVVARRSNNTRLTAASLTGDTSADFLDLNRPVSLDLGADRGMVAADSTRWYYAEGRFRSSGPVEGRRQALRLRGQGFVLDEQRGTVVVSSDCLLQQPGEQLRAQQCLWNWRTQQIMALSESQRLKGRLADGDRFRFNPADARVRSQFRLDSPSIRQTPDASTPPVTF